MIRVPEMHRVGCGALARARPPGAVASEPRDRLTAAELWGSNADSGPIRTAYFSPVGPAAPARHAFQGTVTVTAPTLMR
jgi:hypothetical protein